MAKDWLHYTDGSTAISGLAIPGTHDTASWTHDDDLNLPPFTWAQRLNLREQLDIGIRVMDLRVGWANAVARHLWMFHGPVPVNDQSLDVALADIRAWLDENPREFVVLMFQQQGYPLVKSDCAAEVRNSVNRAFGGRGDRFFHFAADRNSWPTVDDLRGRVMVMERLESRVDGFCNVRAWPDNPTGITLDINTWLQIHLQDMYSSVSGGWFSYESKEVDNLKKLATVEAAARQLPNNYSRTLLKINHLSYSNKRYQPWKLGVGVNTLLRQSTFPLLGFIMIDDADPSTVDFILGGNSAV